VTATHGSLGVLRHEERNGMFTVFAGCAEQIEKKDFHSMALQPQSFHLTAAL
jgi:hypothetical protein